MNESSDKEDLSGFHDQMLGKLALTYKLISNERYLDAIKLQKKEFDEGLETTLKEILIKHEFLSRDEMELLYQAKDIITQKRKEKRFGQIAVKKGLLSGQDLSKALNLQKQENREIGEILIDSGMLSPDQCKEILEIQKTIVVRLPSLNEVQRYSDTQSYGTKIAVSGPGIIELNVSDDEVYAVVIIPEGREHVSVGDIHEILDVNGVKSGIISDESIQENLNCIGLGLTSFIVARGRKSSPGTSGEVTLLFEPRDLRAGLMTDDGTMDFKNRGEIPYVKEGDLLADITQMRQSVAGINIYGGEIEVEEVEDITVIGGEGTVMGEGGNKIYAEYEGEPCINLDGTISILKEYRVSEVNFETGNVIFDGNIFVTGKINADFEVKGKNITAGEILQAKIVADGDVIVENGIIGANITAAGKVQAKYIKDSQISCMGEIVSDKEIIDSVIDTSAVCYARGSILSSRVTAGKGISSVNIGSKISRPNHLNVGVFKTIEGIIYDQEEIKAGLEEEISDLKDEKHNIKSMARIIANVINEIGNEISKHQNELGSVTKFVERIEKKTGKTVSTGRQKIDDITEKIRAAHETIESLKQDQEQNKIKINPLNGRIRGKKEILGKVKRKIKSMGEWMNENKTNPVIRAFDTIVDGTTITSANARLILKDDYTNVTIREVKKTVMASTPDEKNEYTHKLEITRKG